MQTVTIRLDSLEKVKIPLGFVGENLHRRVIFVCDSMFKQYPSAVAALAIVNPAGVMYPGILTREGNNVLWDIRDSDVAVEGNGEIQLTFTENTHVAKEYKCKTHITESIVPNSPAPDPVQDWLDYASGLIDGIPDDIAAALAEAKASGEFDGVGIASIAKTGTSGLVDTYTVTLDNGGHYDFTVTNGQKGDDGVGIQSIAKTSTSGLVDTYTITLTNGQTSEFTVTNGRDGVQIDDTTPASDKVFSSAKVDEELTDVKSGIAGLEQEVESIYITAQTNGTAESGSYTWVSCALTKGIKYKIKVTASKPYNSDIEFSTAGSNQVYVTNPVGILPANKTEVEIIHTPTTKDIAYIRFKVARSDSCVYTIKTYHLESSELSADIDALNDDALLPASAIQITSSNYTDFFTDANYAPVGKTFNINANITSAMIANLPSYGATSILCTIPSMKGEVHGRLQIFSDSIGAVFFRFESGYGDVYNYTKWIAPTALNKMTCKIFKKVVCCGDSYTSGHINTTGTAVDTNEDFAWPHYMETATGNEWVNCGVSGANVLTWQSAQRGLLKAQSCGKAQAYIISLGLNDSDTSGQAHVDVGTSADIGTEAQTYYGGLSKIIRELNTINPTAKIFVNTIPNNSSQYTAYNTAIRTIVEAYKSTYPVYLMDLEANRLLYYNPTLLNDRINGHYTALGYEQFAEIYAFLLSDYITSHFWSFQNVYAIPYDAGSGT